MRLTRPCPDKQVRHCGAWTAAKVGDCLVAEFRRRPYAPVHASPVGVLLAAAVATAGAPREFDPIRLASLSLDRAGERRTVLEWARAKAAGNLRELARQRGHDRGAERRRICVMLARLADAFNAAGVPLPNE